MSKDDKWAGELLFNLALILAGLAFSMWFYDLPSDEQELLMQRTLNLTTVIVALPGILMTTWVINDSKLSWAETIIKGLGVFLLFACALPMGISYGLSSVLIKP